MTARVAVLGAGAWGLTLADYLARKNNDVIVWDRKPAVLDKLRATRSAGRPPDLVLDPSVQYQPDISHVISGCDFLVCAVPSHAVAAVCEMIPPRAEASAIFISCSKGIEQQSLRFPSDVVSEVLGASGFRFAVLAGPTHAEEVSRGVPSAVVASAPELADAEAVQSLFAGPVFRVYIQRDYRGVEIGGAFKNVMAIAAGASDGCGYGDNTKAALITRGVAEIARAAVAMGARAETVAGLSGLGDLIVTAASRHSRNRLFGELLAGGLSTEAALDKVGAVVEGYRTTESAWMLGQRLGVDLPIVNSVYSVLYQGVGVREALNGLLARNQREEFLA